MVQQIQQEGVPLTKETVQAFAALQSEAPEGVSKEEWNQAAILTFKRNLPLTPDTVASLRKVIAGPPMGDVLGTLEQHASALLQKQPALPVADTLTKLVSAIQELRATATAALTPPPPNPAEAEVPAPAAPQGGVTAKASALAGTPHDSSSVDVPAAAIVRPAASPGGEVARPASTAPRVEVQPAGGGTATPPVVVPRAAQPEAAMSTVMAPSLSDEPAASVGEPPVASSPLPLAKQQPAAQEAASAAARADAVSGEAPPAEPVPNWIGKLLKSVGFEHEHQIAKMGEKPDLLLGTAKDDSGFLAAASMAPAADDAAKPAVDTLKSLLLQLASSDDLPAPFKESAQQALQQITGQQLLLTSDRSSMFSHITLFIPFMNGSGQQSAAIHIQSRTGKRGEVDANNCRLLFDLQMKTMGNTLVDVQVVNKIVSLQVHNDQPMVTDLIEGSRNEIASALNKVGYQFVSLKCLPYPDFTAAPNGDSSKNITTDGNKVDLKSLYEPKPYKGVDLRI
jgi:hypothetical protein